MGAVIIIGVGIIRRAPMNDDDTELSAAICDGSVHAFSTLIGGLSELRRD